jgi:glycerophosphoryl diester phosphodiesterase
MKLLIAIGLSFLSLQSFAQSIQERLIPPVVAAHQGGSPWKGKNNTIPKFNAAIKDEANVVEMDLHLTKDNVVVVYHDEELSSDTSCSGKILDKTYAEILKCPYNNGNPIESFENVLRDINGRAVINAEFKIQEVVVPAIQLVQKYKAYEWVYFQTKAERDRYLLARQTDNQVALLYKATSNEELDWILSQEDPNLIIVEMEKEMATPENIQKVHNLYKLVSVNSWRYGNITEEFFSASCDKVFKLNIDIAVTNNVSSCVKQKEQAEQKNNLF